LRDRFAADEAKYAQQLAADALEPLCRQAARSEALAAKRAAERDQLLAGEDANKRKAADAALAKAATRLQAIAAGEPVEYQSVKVTRKALETPAHTADDYPATYPAASTGRRLALARWLTAAENPLTARVAVNHVWLRHFGEPLVESVFDFGRRADKPRHADLLDYLAAEFIESGWSFKHLHRLMVTSQVYRLQSSKAGADPATLAQDPTNQFYWRMNSRRMESQLVRDSLLHLADALDLQLGGPSVPADGTSRRRSLYFLHSRDDQNLFLTMFDDADLLQCYRRSESIVPQQALALSNSELALEMAEKIARQIEQETEADEPMPAFIERAFLTMLARAPDPEEVEACQQFVADLSEAFAARGIAADARPARVRTRLTAALLNHNDFITIR
jgi:hypothetical protein